jgi:hypothetical protein
MSSFFKKFCTYYAQIHTLYMYDIILYIGDSWYRHRRIPRVGDLTDPS